MFVLFNTVSWWLFCFPENSSHKPNLILCFYSRKSNTSIVVSVSNTFLFFTRSFFMHRDNLWDILFTQVTTYYLKNRTANKNNSHKITSIMVLQSLWIMQRKTGVKEVDSWIIPKYFYKWWEKKKMFKS